MGQNKQNVTSAATKRTVQIDNVKTWKKFPYREIPDSWMREDLKSRFVIKQNPFYELILYISR